jgi:hypothetical protein
VSVIVSLQTPATDGGSESAHAGIEDFRRVKLRDGASDEKIREALEKMISDFRQGESTTVVQWKAKEKFKNRKRRKVPGRRPLDE